MRFPAIIPVPALLLAILAGCLFSYSPAENISAFTTEYPVAKGWARNSINAVIFRGHAVTSHDRWQFTSFYNADSEVVLARREHSQSGWELHPTGLRGNTRDAHNAISHALDGNGIVHLSWDHHGHELNYASGDEPLSMELGVRPQMTGENESRVTYPEFFNLPNGDLLFLYRVGGSGAGRLMLNRYDHTAREWHPLQHPLIDGQGVVNAYPNQIAIDSRGHWHISWTWRETSNVATNHNLLYAMSPDEGENWYKSNGDQYNLPITPESAELAADIPQNSALINQTSMTVDSHGRPLIATYWRSEGAETPQFHVVWHNGEDWSISQVSERETPFRLAGGGTRRIPISRPKIAVDRNDNIYVLYRDAERGAPISVAVSRDPKRMVWNHYDLTSEPVDMWEPNYDKQVWAEKNRFHIFKQRVGQGQAETLEEIPPTKISILEWDPAHLFKPDSTP